MSGSRLVAIPVAALLLAPSGSFATGRQFTEVGRPGPVPVPRGAGGPDTLRFGGTVWDPVDGRWEAVPGSTWTFDSGTGSSFDHTDECKNPAFHARMEGWEGHDPIRNGGVFHRIDSYQSPCNVILGSYSMFAGLTPAEADSACFYRPGYGNNWDVSLSRVFAYDGASHLDLTYDYSIRLENGFDFLIVTIDTTGGGGEEIELVSYTGYVSGSENVGLESGSELPSQAGPVLIRFRLVSDGVGSSEDGWVSGCGGVILDNIVASTTAWGGALADSSDFETGDNGWTASVPCGPGDFTRLMDLADLPAFPYTDCLQDSVLVFFDPSIGGDGGIPSVTSTVALSPWIDLAAAEATGSMTQAIEFDVAYEHPYSNCQFMRTAVQFFPDTCWATGIEQVSPVLLDPLAEVLPEGPFCDHIVLDLTDLIPAGATAVRVGIGMMTGPCYSGLCFGSASWPCDGLSHPTPWIDNVRFLVTGDFATDAPAVGGSPAALALDVLGSPFRERVGIRYAVPAGQRGSLAVFDVRGRRVREFAVTGAGTAEWDGLADDGRVAPAGVYLIRLKAGEASRAVRVVRVR